MNLVMPLTFRALGFGWNGGGILLTPSIQSEKLIAVWTKIEPLPLVIVNPVLIIVGLVLLGIGHAIIYRWLTGLLERSDIFSPENHPNRKLSGLISAERVRVEAP
jgi:hypothetical protein